MEIKVGLEGRTFSNSFGKVKLVDDTFYIVKDGRIIGIATKDNVANIPQKLIRIGDLVFINESGWIVSDKSGSMLFSKLKGMTINIGNINQVNKILTPNANKSVYTEVWRKSK